MELAPPAKTGPIPKTPPTPVATVEAPLGVTPTRSELEDTLGEAVTRERDLIKVGRSTLPERNSIEDQIAILDEGVEA